MNTIEFERVTFNKSENVLYVYYLDGTEEEINFNDVVFFEITDISLTMELK